jgi:hypothetical protein
VFSQALSSLPPGEKRVLRLREDLDAWLGFNQEVRDILRANVSLVGTLAGHGAPEQAGKGLTLSWKVKAPEAAEGAAQKIPTDVEFTLSLDGQSRVPTAGLHLTPKQLTPKLQKDCALTDLSFKQTAAAQAALWIMRLSTPATKSDDPPQPKVNEKDWRYAPLGLVLSGLPQLLDANPDNDVRGTVLVLTDIALVSAAAVLVLQSVGARRDYSNSGNQATLDHANTLLRAGYVVGAAAAIPRLLSFFW